MNESSHTPSAATAPPRRISRGRLLSGAAGALTAAGVAGVTVVGLARGGTAALTARDRTILRFALSIEHLQAAFYGQALAAGHLTGEARQFAEIVGGEERTHVRYLQTALGAPVAVSPDHPRPADGESARFIATAVALEEIGLAAYNGQAENLSRSALASVSRIISVEARHAAWARSLAGELPAPHPTDAPIAAAAAMARLRPLLQS